MTTATIAVRGNAIGEFPPDFAVVHFHHQFGAPARSEALAHGNDVAAQLRDVTARSELGVREIRVRNIRVVEMFKDAKPGHAREPYGWGVQVEGEATAGSRTVPEVAAALTKVGVSISHVSWQLDPESEASAYRTVRRQAVANALEAASDFAVALGGTVGQLITLADSGLLGAGAFEGSQRGPIRAAGAFHATATASGVHWDDRADIDPYPITVDASVEARYEVNLG